MFTVKSTSIANKSQNGSLVLLGKMQTLFPWIVRLWEKRVCARLFKCALWSPTGKGLTSWLSFVVSNCEFVTFPLVSWVRCGTWLYRFLIFAPLLTFNTDYRLMQVKSIAECSKGEHSAMLTTFIKLPFSIKAIVLSIFKWPLKTGVPVYVFLRRFSIRVQLKGNKHDNLSVICKIELQLF